MGYHGRPGRHGWRLDGDDIEEMFEGFSPKHGMGGCAGGCMTAFALYLAVSVIAQLASLAVHSPAFLILIAWAIAGAVIYRYLTNKPRTKRRVIGTTIVIEREDDEHEDEAHEREAQAPEQPGQPRFSIGDSALALVAGFGLALSLGMAFTGVAAESWGATIAASLLGILGGVSIFSLFRRWGRAAKKRDEVTYREARGQVYRIKKKAARLRREAKRVGGVFGDLEWQALELADQAGELCKLFRDLRRAERATRRGKAENPALPKGLCEEGADETLQREFEATRASHERLDNLLAQNQRNQHMCIAQLERIEDLLDTARLELTQPMAMPGTQSAGANAIAPPIVDEVETGLQAARQALAEVQGIEE